MPLYSFDQLKTKPNMIVRTKSLFYELSYEDPSHALFTTKEHNIEAHGRHYVSLHKLFVSMVPNDPTEYEFAMEVFGSWDVWEKISGSPQVAAHVNKWRREVAVKVKSKAIKAIAEEVENNGRSSFSAAKLLLEKGWLDKDNASQAKRKLAAKEQEEEEKEALSLLSQDAKRLGINIQ